MIPPACFFVFSCFFIFEPHPKIGHEDLLQKEVFTCLAENKALRVDGWEQHVSLRVNEKGTQA